MDRFEQRLREDAERIDATVSPEFDERLRASLAGLAKPAPQRAQRPSPVFWWASSLTGLAAALAVIAVVSRPPPPPAELDVPRTVAGPDSTPPLMPLLKTESAVLTAPLEQELDDLESDLEKARDAVREDLGFQL